MSLSENGVSENNYLEGVGLFEGRKEEGT